MQKSSILIFLSFLLVASWLVQGLAIYFVGDLSSARAAPWLVSLMFFPTLAAIIYRLGFNSNAFAHVRFWPGNPLYLILGALIPAATTLAVLAIVENAGWGSCDYFGFSVAGAELKKGPWVLGLGTQSWWMFALNIAATAIAYALVNSIAAVGEEFAWRGFLQKPMMDNFGMIGGVALLGLVWAYWHLPANLAGYNYPHSPVLGGLVLFPALLLADSFIMAWLTIRAKSFWPAVLMHGSGNGIQEGILGRITLAEGMPRLWIDFTTLAVAAVLGVVCTVALMRKREPQCAAFVIEGPGESSSALGKEEV